MTNDTNHTYTYDAMNWLAKVDGGSTATYTYLGALRVKKVAGATSTVYVYSGTKPIAEYATDSTGTKLTEYIYAGAGTMLATIHSDGSITYEHPDHLSIRAESDASGNLIRSTGHFPFGEAWYDTSPGSKWQFTTYERDSESQLDYAMFRSYSSRLGRFMSPDPMPGSTASPESLNGYTYVGNDPVNATDPTGLCRFWWDVWVSIDGGKTWTWVGRICTDDSDEGGFQSGGGARGKVTGKVSKGGKAVNTALDALLKKLANDPDCLKFLGSGANFSPDQVLSQADTTFRNLLGQADIEPAGTAALGGAAVPPEYAQQYMVVINNNGPFFKDALGNKPVNQGMLPPIEGPSPQAQQFILLHELAHAFGAKGFQEDAGNDELEKANNKLLEKNCGKTLAGK